MSVVHVEVIKGINLEAIDKTNPELGRRFRNATQFITSEYGKDRLARVEQLVNDAKTGMIFELNNDNIEEARQQAALITGLEEAKEAEAESHIAISTMEEQDE